MKILVLANNDVGLFKFRRELLQELLKDNEVVISCPYGMMVDSLIRDGCRFKDIPIDRRGINPFTDLKLIIGYLRLINIEKPDLTILYTIKPNIYGGVVCRLLKVPYAINITGLGTTFEKDGWLKSFVIRLYKLAAKSAKVVFFENVENKNIFLEYKLISRQQAKLLNGAGVNLEYYNYQDYPNNNEFRFLFVGRVMKEKGIDELLSSMKKLVLNYNCILDVIGPCEEDYHSLLNQYEQEGWLFYHGFQEDVRPYIKQCDCFVLPSYHEGMANTILECAASGRPIITSNIHGCKEAVINENSGFLCNPKNDIQLYSLMEKMLKLPRSRRVEMGLNARAYMERKFNKSDVVKSTIHELME